MGMINSLSNFAQFALSSALAAASESSLLQFYRSFHLFKIKISRLKSFRPTQFCQVRCQYWKKVPYWIFFFFISRSKTTHIASFLFSDSCPSAAKISLLALTVASLDNHIVLHVRCNCRPFVFILVWYIARQADRNGETVKHFHNCIKMLTQFHTPYCTNLCQYSKRPKRGDAHDNAQIPYLQFSLPTSAPENCVGL